MSYKRLEELEKERTELSFSIIKAKNLIEKLKLSIIEKAKKSSILILEKEEIKSKLVKIHLKVGDEFISPSFGKARGGDKIKVIRINKKSITFKILDIGDTWKRWEHEKKRIGFVFRYDNEKSNRVLFNQMETAIKREEKLKALNI